MSRKKHLGALAAFSLALTSFAGAVGSAGPAAYADDRDDLVQQQKDQEAQIESTKSSLEGVDSDLQAVYLDLEETKTNPQKRLNHLGAFFVIDYVPCFYAVYHLVLAVIY